MSEVSFGIAQRGTLPGASRGPPLMLLVDSSVWILVFRKFEPLDLSAIAAFEEVVTCLPVIQEVLQGIREEPAYARVREAMLALPLVESPMTRDLFETA